MASREHEETPIQPAHKPTRSERLAAALRANLRRRKAQARSREAGSEPEPGFSGDRDSQSARGKRDR
jgi:hypothetical protein